MWVGRQTRQAVPLAGLAEYMSKLLLLYCVLVFGLLFLVVPEYTRMISPFLFSDFQLSLATHIYFICEKLTMIILAYIIANESEKYREAIWIFFWLMVADLVDYTFAYNGVYGYLNGFPVSMNVIKCLVFGLTILYTWIRTLFN